MNLNFWPKMYGAGGGGGGGGAGGGSGSSGSSGSGSSSSYYASSGEQSPIQPTPVGAFRFNTDSSMMEYYDGNQWVNITSTSPDVHTGGTRGIICGGRNNGSGRDNLQFVNMDSTGNFSDFGDLTGGKRVPICFASRVLGHVNGDISSGSSNVLTIASTGSASDKAIDMSGNRYNGAGIADSTRGIVAGGADPSSVFNIIEYITMTSTGDFVDFGDLSQTTQSCGGCSSPVRGIIMGGHDGSNRVNTIAHIQISTLGNAADFGDLLSSKTPNQAVMSNAVRGLGFGGGAPGPVAGNNNTIEFITIATLGNSIDFGDSTANGGDRAGCSSPTRAICNLGANSSDTAVDYVQIMSTGNARDFGDLHTGNYECGALSNGHGGLG